MSRPAAPVLTVRSGQSHDSFAAGPDVVVGSDPHANFRVAHPLIARAHVLLRFAQGRWIAVDNNSPNGMFVNGRRVDDVDIHDGLIVNLGKRDGPRITFEVGHHQRIVDLLRPTETVLPPRPGTPPPAQPPYPPNQPQPPRHPEPFAGMAPNHPVSRFPSRTPMPTWHRGCRHRLGRARDRHRHRHGDVVSTGSTVVQHTEAGHPLR